MCDYCGKEFYRTKSKESNSKSGLHFCCREHKDLAQRLDSGKEFDCMRPNHYGQGVNYRSLALDRQDHKCAICNYDGDGDISLLDVHHIDSDRNNNGIDNLIILCPICHRKITSGKYILSEDKKYLIKADKEIV